MAQGTLGKSSLYLPPIEDGIGVIPDFYDRELHWPAGSVGFVGMRKVTYTPLECDKEPAYAYRRRAF